MEGMGSEVDLEGGGRRQRQRCIRARICGLAQGAVKLQLVAYLIIGCLHGSGAPVTLTGRARELQF